MTTQDSVAQVLKRLSEIARTNGETLNAKTIDFITQDAQRRLAEGWTVDEVVWYLTNMEEVNPDLEEDIAVRRMQQITSRVKTRLASL